MSAPPSGRTSGESVGCCSALYGSIRAQLCAWVDGLFPLLGAVFKEDPFHDIMFHFALEQGHRKRARSEELRQGLFNRLRGTARSEELRQV